MHTQAWKRWPTAVALLLTILLPPGHLAQAQTTREAASEAKALVIRESALVIAPDGPARRHKQAAFSAPRRACNKGRRALIGAIIGGVVAIPLARFTYRRFDNEAATATGQKLAALVIGGSAGAGALIGLQSCN